MALLYNPFLMIHTIAATVALIVGGVLFLRSKGTFAHRRLGREAAQALSISALAARGDANEIRRQHKELTRE